MAVLAELAALGAASMAWVAFNAEFAEVRQALGHARALRQREPAGIRHGARCRGHHWVARARLSMVTLSACQSGVSETDGTGELIGLWR